MGNTINIGNSAGSVVIGGSVHGGTVAASGKTGQVTVFDTATELLQKVPDEAARSSIGHAIEGMRAAAGTPSFAQRYKEFVSTAEEHISIFANALGPLANLVL